MISNRQELLTLRLKAHNLNHIGKIQELETRGSLLKSRTQLEAALTEEWSKRYPTVNHNAVNHGTN
jgi:hypothetical protein